MAVENSSSIQAADNEMQQALAKVAAVRELPAHSIIAPESKDNQPAVFVSSGKVQISYPVAGILLPVAKICNVFFRLRRYFAKSKII